MAKPNILVVEDEGILAQDIADTLINFNYRVSAIVDSGEQALKNAKAQQPNLILMDIKINGNLDGIDAAKQIKELYNIPVVFLTAYADDTTLKRAQIIEPFGYVLKPFREKELQTAIEMALYKHKMENERRQTQQALRESEARFAGILNIAQEAIVSIDQLKRIILFNTGAEQIFGYSSDEIIGESIDLLISNKFQEVHLNHIAEFVGSPMKSRLMGERSEIFGRRKNGEEFPAEATISKLELGNNIVLTAILRDITERKRMEQSLRDALSEVKKLKNQLQAENIYLQEEIKQTHNFEEIVGNSDALLYVLNRVEQIAPTDTTVLILGETGTGKELFARAIHSKSERKDTPFIKVNCAALPAHLIESELFGHEKGAFTGAQSRRRGRFELADGGTIFLDEIGELPLELQPKLLRVLQEGELERLGDEETLTVDVRVLAATNRDLASEVREGRFRLDLFYRLNVFPLTVPPLRDRLEDIELLAKFFIEKFSNKLGKCIDKVSQQVMFALKNYDWPGNIRELENVIERAVIVTLGSEFRLVDKLEFHKMQGFQSNTDQSLAEIEREYIVQVLEKTHWRIEGDAGAAKILDLHPNTLRNRMLKLNIRRPINNNQYPLKNHHI